MAFNAQKAMFLIERPARSVGFYHREFIVDCPHATTNVVIGNYPETDKARAGAIFANLVRDHRAGVAAAVAAGREDEECRCQPTKTRLS